MNITLKKREWHEIANNKVFQTFTRLNKSLGTYSVSPKYTITHKITNDNKSFMDFTGSFNNSDDILETKTNQKTNDRQPQLRDLRDKDLDITKDKTFANT